MKQLLFIMPFGKKTLSLNEKSFCFNFDDVYQKLKREIEELYLDINVNRVDEFVGTDIYAKMYKAIHSADIVFADLTTLNANVMYELGMRHSLREKKTVLFFQDEIDTQDIPFDIKTYHVWKASELTDRLKEIIENDDNDSPIKKEISNKSEEDKHVFENFSKTWTNFTSNLELANNNEKDVIENYKSQLSGIEYFDQKYALSIYQENENDLKKLYEAWKIIKKYDPLHSNNYETIGLACSISRRIFDFTKNEKDRLKSFNCSMHFLSIFKCNYSFSSLVLHLVSEIEYDKNNNDISIEYYKEVAKKILNDFKNSDSTKDPNYYIHTKALINAFNNIQDHTYEDDKKNKDPIFIKSKRAYEKVLKICSKTIYK